MPIRRPDPGRDEPKWSAAHDAAASFGRVGRFRAELLKLASAVSRGFEGGEARVAWRSAGVEPSFIDEPAVSFAVRAVLKLGVEPSVIGVVEYPNSEAEATVLPDRCTDHALDCKERHLGVVSNTAVRAGARDAFGQVLLDAISSAFALDPLKAPELDRSTERVADRAAQKAAADSRAIALTGVFI